MSINIGTEGREGKTDRERNREREREKEWLYSDYKELSPKMEADKSQGPQSELTGWRPRKVNVYFQTESNSLKNRIINVVVLIWRPTGMRHRKNLYFSLSPKTGKSNVLVKGNQVVWNFLLFWEIAFPPSPFVLFRPSTDWLRLTHCRDGNTLYSL